MFLEEDDGTGTGGKRLLADDLVLRYLLQYITIQLGVRLLSPKSFKKVYIAGVKKIFGDYNKEASAKKLGKAFATKVAKELVRGFERMYAKEHPDGEGRKIPFTADLVGKALKRMCEGEIRPDLHPVEVLRVHTAMSVGVGFLLRCSEHIKSKKGTARPPYRGEIIFRDVKGKIVPYSKVGLIKAMRVTIYTAFSKGDVMGKGRIVTHSRQPDSAPFCVIQTLERWYKLTRDEWGALETDALYDLPRQTVVPVSLSLELLSDVMTKTTDIEEIHFKDEGSDGEVALKRVTSHSLRYGGATTMAAAGFPEHIIALYGGWAKGSTSLRRYISQLTNATLEKVSAAFAKAAKIDAAQTFIDDHQVREIRKGNKCKGHRR